MLLLSSLGEQIAAKRKALGLTHPTLAKKAKVGLSTLDALESGSLRPLGSTILQVRLRRLMSLFSIHGSNPQ